ncbi:24707_t:CDS:2 [Gigaspora rosea]|nr:24707_t:CDS:2 [Gigaspora rosea]
MDVLRFIIIFQNTLLLNLKTEIIQAHLRPSDALPSPDPLSPLITIQFSDATDTLLPKTPPQTPREFREFTYLLNTPNKHPIEKKEFWDYTQNNSVICAFALIAKELETEIGTELTKELFSMRDRNPVVWNSDLEEYINATLKESGKNFKNAVRNKNYKDIDENFRLYCEKVLIDFYNLVDVDPNIDRKIGEQKHIIYQVLALFKFYERTFLILDVDWIESHSRPAKLMKSESNSGIVLVDTKATKLSDGLDVWHLEVAGPPYNAPYKHILGDSKKTIRIDILNLITILWEHLDCDINLAMRIKVFNSRLTLYSLNILHDGRFLLCELASAVMPFSFKGRHQYKSVLRMMPIFHDELIKQDELLEEINESILHSKNVTVRQVLKTP